MAGNSKRVERDARELERLVPCEADVGRVRAQADTGRDEAVDVLEQRSLVLGHVHRRAGSLGQIGDAAEVVPVAVRDQDRHALRPRARQLEAKLRRVSAGIDDDRLGRVAARADDVAVRPDRSDLVTIDGKAHGVVSLLLPARLGSLRAELEPA